MRTEPEMVLLGEIMKFDSIYLSIGIAYISRHHLHGFCRIGQEFQLHGQQSLRDSRHEVR